MASRVGAGSASSRVSSTGEVSGPPQGGGSCLLWEAAAVCRVSARLEETGLRCCSGAAWPAPSAAGGPPGVTCWRATAGAGGKQSTGLRLPLASEVPRWGGGDQTGGCCSVKQ